MGDVIWILICCPPLLLLVHGFVHLQTLVIVLEIEEGLLSLIFELWRIQKRNAGIVQLTIFWVQPWCIFFVVSISTLFLRLNIFFYVRTHGLREILRSVIISYERGIYFISLILIWWHKFAFKSSWLIIYDWADIDREFLFISLRFFIIWLNGSLSFWWSDLWNSTLINY